MKAIALLLVLVLHAGLIAILIIWLVSTFLVFSGDAKADSLSRSYIKGWHNGDICQSADSQRQIIFDGVVRDSCKNPDAESLHTEPCGQSAAEARARGCRSACCTGHDYPKRAMTKKMRKTSESIRNGGSEFN